MVATYRDTILATEDTQFTKIYLPIPGDTCLDKDCEWLCVVTLADV